MEVNRMFFEHQPPAVVGNIFDGRIAAMGEFPLNADALCFVVVISRKYPEQEWVFIPNGIESKLKKARHFKAGIEVAP